MGTFETIATQQLGLLWYIFMVGNVFLMLPGGIPADACGTELLCQRVILANYFLVRATFAAAVLLFTVMMCVGAAEASAFATAAAGDKAFDAKHGATVEGPVVSNTLKWWRRASLSGMLLFAVRMCVIAIKATMRAAARAATRGDRAFCTDREAWRGSALSPRSGRGCRCVGCSSSPWPSPPLPPSSPSSSSSRTFSSTGAAAKPGTAWAPRSACS